MKFNNVSDAGSSPLTRGARLRCLGEHEAIRIIPAYAGSTHLIMSWLCIC